MCMKQTDIKELILVYNADSTLFAAASDFVKKLTNPDEYECNLCKVTYGASTMKSPWKAYLDSLPCKVSFYHRDDFRRSFPDETSVSFPSILVRTTDGALHELVPASSINTAKTVDELTVRFDTALHAYGGA